MTEAWANAEGLLSAVERMARMVFETLGEVQPTFVAMAHKPAPDQPPLMVVQCQWRDERDKEGALKALRALFKQTEVALYGFMGEAWMVDA